MMSEHYTILYEDTSPSRARIAYYNALTAGAAFTISWVAFDPLVSREEVLKNKLADGILITGREDADDLLKAGLTVHPSTVDEQKLVALFSGQFGIEQTSDQQTGISSRIRLVAGFNWQAKLVSNFLSKALPAKYRSHEIVQMPDAGFDEQLAAFENGNADVVIVSLADLILHNPAYLITARYMILPLFECTPGLFQGYTAIAVKKDKTGLVASLDVVAADPERRTGIADALNQAITLSLAQAGREHGAFHKNLPMVSFTYLDGVDEAGNENEYWQMPEPKGWDNKKLVASTTFMKDFFSYSFFKPAGIGAKRVSFVASHKSIHEPAVVDLLRKQEIWAAGTRTWYELAKKDLWVSGSADGLGMELLSETWALPGINIQKLDVEILTNTESAETWQLEGWTSFGTYELIPSFSTELEAALADADIVFWTSFRQYKSAEMLIGPAVKHATPAGKTAQLLAGKSPFIFPSIRAFNWWLKQRK